MARRSHEKGFTLIELLIVITIIGILAVAFLPTLLGAPARGRDTQRVADLQKLQKVLIDGDLTGQAYPSTGCVNDTNFSAYLAALGGTSPTDPQAVSVTHDPLSCSGEYGYIADPTGDGTYAFGLYAQLEGDEGNNNCTHLSTVTDGGSCYMILTQ